MAGDAKKLQPIIIKKVKKGGHAVHGGAWKIAYADFVTAMMAFFLLMWLLGSTSEGDKKGIADYFQSPLKVALMGGGSGAGDASHVVKGGGQDLSRSNGQVKRGDVEAPRKTVNLQALRAEQTKAEAAKLEELKEKVMDVLEALTGNRVNYGTGTIGGVRRRAVMVCAESRSAWLSGLRTTRGGWRARSWWYRSSGLKRMR